MKANVVRIPCTINRDSLLKKLHIKPNSNFIERIDDLIEQALEISNPKIAYKLSYVDFKDKESVTVEGIQFRSRVLRVNLEETFKIVPFVVTCGKELEKWANSYNNMFENFFMDGIVEAILLSARNVVFPKIDKEYNLGHAVNMSPGSLTDWPIKEQKHLFQLLGDVEELIGVKLTKSFLMSPIKSISGIRFPKEDNFENCQLCPREKCPDRKTPFEQNLYKSKYQKT